MLIVVSLIALVAGLAYPSVSTGLDGLRLRSASDAILGFLNTALIRAESRQQVVEILISPGENALIARSSDGGFSKRLDVAAPVKIVAGDSTDVRRYLVYPGGAIPRIALEIATSQGHKRAVSVDPLTGTPQSVVEK